MQRKSYFLGQLITFNRHRHTTIQKPTYATLTGSGIHAKLLLTKVLLKKYWRKKTAKFAVFYYESVTYLTIDSLGLRATGLLAVSPAVVSGGVGSLP